MNSKLPERVMLAAFSIYAFVYPFALFLLSFDLMPFGMEWMSSLLLALLGVTSWAWLWVEFGARGVAVGACIVLLGLAIEYIGVQIGVPFGSYTYTGVLVPELFGGVPLAIGFAWLLIIVSGLFSARWAMPNAALLPVCAIGAFLAVGFDFLLEPVAYHVKGYWLWHEEGGYYGVPWVNFAAWLGIAFALNLLVGAALRLKPRAMLYEVPPRGLSVGGHERSLADDGPRVQPPGSQRDAGWVPIALYVMNVAMFATVDVTHGFWWSGLIGLLLLSGLWLLRRAPSTRHARSATIPSN